MITIKNKLIDTKVNVVLTEISGEFYHFDSGDPYQDEVLQVGRNSPRCHSTEQL